MHEGLMDSPGHRANILDPDVAYVGVGLRSEAIVGGIERRRAYLTENFADTDGQVARPGGGRRADVLQPYLDGEPVGEPCPGRRRSDHAGIRATDDPDDEDEDDATAASAGGCFVATAAYGEPHPSRRRRPPPLPRRGPRPLRRRGAPSSAAYRALGPRLARFVSPAGPSGRSRGP